MNINESIQAFRSVGIPIPDIMVKIILILLFIVLIYELLIKIKKFFSKIYKTIKIHFYDRETRQFIEIRNIFIDHLDSEVKRLNREADWSDFHYTKLEAEVEVDPSPDLNTFHSKNPRFWLSSLYHLAKNTIGIAPSFKIQKNLIKAIMNSKSRAFLVIGDPGSGKTVSLRYLFRKMAKNCISSKNKDGVVPIYLNLKQLDLKPSEIDANKIHDWIIKQLRANQDRTIHEFLDKNFERMLKDGAFFFLFDSFDEIPAVMDAQEEQEVVHQYAIALDRFLHSQHHSRGLVSSRPYRAPKTFIGQKMIIRTLSNKRIKKALYKYMEPEVALADQLWHELVKTREDLLYIAKNPFYLGLLARYVKVKQVLPESHYDLFEHFVQNRARTDEERLQSFGITPEELIERSSILAFAMTNTSHLGLEANINQVYVATNSFDETSGWDKKMVEPLLHALAYSKLGRLSQEEPGKPRTFSFVHRRFHEYFCARYLTQNQDDAPFENLAADDRWREILVLLTEVLPSIYLTRIFDIVQTLLKKGLNADSGTLEYRKAIESIRFLRDGFTNRIEDIPHEIRELCSKFIQKQLKIGTLLDKKRAIEGVSLADNDSVQLIIESALTSNSPWLRETALRSCRILNSVPEQIAKEIRLHLYNRYAGVEIYKDYSFYSVFFSSNPALHTFKSYLRILLIFTLFQFLILIGIFVFGLMFESYLLSMIPSVVFIFWLIQSRFEGINPSSHSYRRLSRTFNNNLWTLTSFYFFIILITPIISQFLSFMDARLDYNFSIDVSFIPFNWILSILFIFIILSNLFLISLITFYPHSRMDLLLYPIHLIKNLFWALRLALINWKFTSKWITLFIFMISIVFIGVFWISFVMDVLINNNFSTPIIYSEYGFIPATAIVLTLVGFVAMSIIVLTFMIWNLGKILSDQSKLIKLHVIPDDRPSTALEAIEIIRNFKSDLVKIQYVSALFKWIPLGKDPQVLIEEARQYDNIISDKLCQLAEIWEDSMRKRK